MRVADAVERLRERYLAAMPQKIATLEAGLSSLKRGEGAGAIRALAHQISGSAESFGYLELGLSARDVEQASDEGLEIATRVLIGNLRTLLPSSE